MIIQLMNTMYMLALNFQLFFPSMIFFRLTSGSEKEEGPGVGGSGWVEDWVCPKYSFYQAVRG